MTKFIINDQMDVFTEDGRHVGVCYGEDGKSIVEFFNADDVPAPGEAVFCGVVRS